jgi:glycine dehydrogenase
VNSTSAERRRRPTSARRKCCWPTSPGLYAAWHGPQGLRRIAERIHRYTCLAADGLRAAGLELVNDSWFDTLQVRCDAVAIRDRAAAAGLDLRFVDDRTIGFSFDETTTSATLAVLLAVFGVDFNGGDTATEGIPHRRSDEFLTQTVFARYHTEHEMLRYLRRLSDKDLALDRTMIPLGSCTMKLNATVEMEPLTWPGLADMHPFSPDDTTVGIRTMIAQLEAMLVAITGYDAGQPAAQRRQPGRVRRSAWRSTPTTAVAVTGDAMCVSSRRAHTAPTRPVR